MGAAGTCSCPCVAGREQYETRSISDETGEPESRNRANEPRTSFLPPIKRTELDFLAAITELVPERAARARTTDPNPEPRPPSPGTYNPPVDAPTSHRADAPAS